MSSPLNFVLIRPNLEILKYKYYKYYKYYLYYILSKIWAHLIVFIKEVKSRFLRVKIIWQFYLFVKWRKVKSYFM